MFRRPQHNTFFCVAWLVVINPVVAQRVQFPSAVSPDDVVPPSYSPSAPAITPTFDPYANSNLGAPPADVPYSVAPQLGQPQYAQPQLGQPVLPQAAPPVTPPVPQQGGSLFPSGLPYSWDSSTYQYGNSDGTVSRLQRFLQQLSAEHTFLYDKNDYNGFEVNRTELSATFGMPIFYNPDTPLLITPGFAFNWFEGPGVVGADMPPRAYDAYIDGAWHPQFNQFLGADLGLRTGVWTDFHELTDDSIRILGRGLGVIAITPQFDVLAGVWYLDRNEVKLLPAGGFHWRPNNLWDIYAVFPNPKIRRRSINVGASQWWVYFAGEYGGDRWTVQREFTGDDVDYNDIRVLFGIEWETQTQARGHLEVGYVFNRELVFAGSGDPTLELDDSIMFRGGIDF